MSSLPRPGQGRCVKCGHFALIHGDGRCHHVASDDCRPEDYCKCDGFEAAPFVECLICQYKTQCIVTKDLTIYKPFAWKYADDGESLFGWCPGCL